MSGFARAVLAATFFSCGLLSASAAELSNGPQGQGQWLGDGACWLFGADAHPGDTVRWTGACVDGYAEGLGTATFNHEGQVQSLTATFVRGVIPDGHVINRWGRGWSYDGEIVGGRFQGAGILTTDACNRFDGHWTAGRMNGFGVFLGPDGALYAGDWKDGRPNGNGELRRADGTLVSGLFVDGKLVKAAAPVTAGTMQNLTNAPGLPFAGLPGPAQSGADGASIALTLIEDSGEALNRLDQFEPPGGHCERTRTAFAN